MIRPRRYESNASYLERLRKHYGVVLSPVEGGYLLPDGTFLDFSEGEPGQRSQDHRNVTWVSVREESARESRTDVMHRVMRRTGMIRWMPESWVAHMVKCPTTAQLRMLAILSRMRPITIDAERGRSRFYHEYTDESASAVIHDIRRFYSG